MTAPPPRQEAPDGVLGVAVPDVPEASPPAGLFGAAGHRVPVAGRVRPVPTVAIGGVDVASGPRDDGTWPDLMVVDGVSVRWGREEVLEQATAATATVAVFDPTATWAASTELVGQVLTLRWSWEGSSRVYFRGRVAAVEVQRKTVARRDGSEVQGALVTLSGSSILTDLGNRSPAELEWPAESVANRRARLVGYIGGVLSGLTTRPYWDGAQCAPTKTDSASIWEQVELLYNTTGADRHTFDPATSALGWLQRRDFQGDAGLAHLYWDPSLRTGVFIQSLMIAPSGSTSWSAPLFVDAQVVEYSEGVTKDMGSRLTRVGLGYFDQDDNHGARTITKTIPGMDEAVVGQRAATMDTLHAWRAWADVCASDLAGFAAREGSGWRLEPLRWDTSRSNGFENIAQAELFLRGVELFSMYYLQGSWLPQVGIRPVFAVIGGTIEYRRRAWTVEWHNAPISTTATQPAELTWDHVDAGDPYTVVWDEDDNPMGMHSSVTWEDLQFVALGFGVTQLPTDGA